MPSDAHLTTPLIWTCTSILAVLDGILIALARHLVSQEQFRRMRWVLVVTAGIFFLLVWSIVLWWGWDWFYIYIFPPWARHFLPPVFAIGDAWGALLMHWLSLKLPGSPGVTWCLLGGIEGLLSHLYAIYGLGAASKPPIMQGSDPFAVLIFAIFEKAFYWSLILLACKLLWRGKVINALHQPGNTSSV
jgi:hypothetical protein